MSKMRKRMGKQSRESTNMPSMQESILERTKKNKERWKQMNRVDKVKQLTESVGRRQAIIERMKDTRTPNYGLLEKIDIEHDMLAAMEWISEVAKCFREGDVRCIKAITGIMQAVTGQETYRDEMDCLRRMLEAATIMEDDD